AVAEGGDHSGQLVPRDRRCSVTVAAIGPGRGPLHLSRDESRRMNLNDDVVYRCRRLGPLHQRHSGRSRSLVRYHDCFHGNRLLCSWSWGRRSRYVRKNPCVAIIIPAEIRTLLEAPNYVHLATLRADGSPRNWVVWVGLEGDNVLVCTDESTWKA